MVQDVDLHPKDLIYPIFIEEGNYGKAEIKSMPGQFRYTLNGLDNILEEIMEAQIGGVILFGIPKNKDLDGSGAFKENGIVQQATLFIKQKTSLTIITDTCMCEYTSHGHCGILDSYGEVDNDQTLNYLKQTAVSQAKAGADIIAPSDMMDGRVLAIRKALDEAGFSHIPIMSYSVKYASSFYGPFRDAADSAPSFGDRRGYQMDFRRKKEHFIEAEADLEEGADYLIVKPASAYLDIIKDLADTYDVPIVCYNVSGEYAMVKAAAQQGWIDEKKIVMETMYGFKRAGAKIIMTYFALDIARYLKDEA